MDQQSTAPAAATDITENPAPTNISAQHSNMGPNDTEESDTSTHKANLVTTESEVAEGKLLDSKEDSKTEIDVPNKTLQSNPNTRDGESFTITYTPKDENKDFSVTCDTHIKDPSGSSGPSFVVLPVQTKDEPSSTVSLWSMSEHSSFPSVLSSTDSSNVCSREYIRLEVNFILNYCQYVRFDANLTEVTSTHEGNYIFRQKKINTLLLSKLIHIVYIFNVLHGRIMIVSLRCAYVLQ